MARGAWSCRRLWLWGQGSGCLWFSGLKDLELHLPEFPQSPSYPHTNMQSPNPKPHIDRRILFVAYCDVRLLGMLACVGVGPGT